jgi:hypothetical protein
MRANSRKKNYNVPKDLCSHLSKGKYDVSVVQRFPAKFAIIAQ